MLTVFCGVRTNQMVCGRTISAPTESGGEVAKMAKPSAFLQRAYLPEYIMYGDYIKLSGTETPAEIRRGTELLAEQAGECVKQAILGGADHP